MNHSEVNVLIKKAFKAKYKSHYWNQITKLRTFVNNEMISRCFEMIYSDDVKFKQIGIDVLCQLGNNRESFVESLFDKIFKILRTTSDENLICTSLFAIGHNNQYLKTKHFKTLEQFKNSESKEIRYALTFSLLGVENYKAVTMMIKLAQDRSLRVRDWATFGLGTQIECDNEDIRHVLYKNCFSKDHQIRHEAIKGLANREDKRAKAVILQELKSESYESILFDTLLNIKRGEQYIPDLMAVYDKVRDNKNINPQWIADLKNCIEILKINQ